MENTRDQHTWISPYIIPGENTCTCGYKGFTTTQGHCPRRGREIMTKQHVFPLFATHKPPTHVMLRKSSNEIISIWVSYDGIGYAFIGQSDILLSEVYNDPC